MAEKRKSAFKHPYRCRRNRSSTPAPDLLSPYLPGPELFISPPMSTIQTRPVYSTARSDSSLSSASPFTFRYSSSASPMMSFGLNLVPSSSGSSYNESSVVEDLSIRSTAQTILPPQLDWYRPSGPSTSYMVPTQSNFMTSTSSNPWSGVQRFFQEFRLPDYTLGSFSGRLLDVVSSMTFSSGDVQAELCHAITRLMAFACIFESLIFILLNYSVFGFLNFICDFLLYIYIDCLIYMNQGCVISLTVKPI